MIIVSSQGKTTTWFSSGKKSLPQIFQGSSRLLHKICIKRAVHKQSHLYLIYNCLKVHHFEPTILHAVIYLVKLAKSNMLHHFVRPVMMDFIKDAENRDI
jgi:hypothetical protein